MTNSSIHSIAASITRKYGMGECQSCANALANELSRSGIKGKILQIQALGARPYIVMEDVNFKLPWSGSAEYSITHNGFHYGVLAGNTVYDNIHRAGISQEKWLKSFTCDGGRFKLEIIREF